MTIHSDWSRILHEECPTAFSKKAPRSKMEVGIIDGHLQLMRLDARMQTWECFIRNQFLKPIQIMFNLGCPRVVLCFDNYTSVPVYKSMTQCNRTSKYEIKNFGPCDELPEEVPDEPIQYLMNRYFKLKLIDMLCRQIPCMVELKAGQEFILDYKKVVSYTSQCKVPVLMKDMVSMGESDVKFCRYVTKYGNALVHAIDGDYMAIALLYYTQHAMNAENKIYIYRQLSVLHPSSSASSETKTNCNKRKLALAGSALHSRTTKKKREMDETDAPIIQSVFFKPCHKAQGEGEDPTTTGSPKCWVDMQMIYLVIANAMRQAKYHECIHPHTHQPYTDQDAVYSIVFLMLCAGTDFSRNTPFLGPKRMWEAIPLICSPLLQAVRGSSSSSQQLDSYSPVNYRLFLNSVLGQMYVMSYPRHVPSTGTAMNLKTIMETLQRSKLSTSTKQKLPSLDRLNVTLCNIEWVIKYWTMENGIVETPVDGRYGYVAGANGEITYKDQQIAGH